MNARRCSAVHARGKVMMRAPSSAGGLMPPMRPPPDQRRVHQRALVVGASSVPRCVGKAKVSE
jgi:hypothetical protein